jgi:hypothetical protein
LLEGAHAWKNNAGHDDDAPAALGADNLFNSLRDMRACMYKICHNLRRR